MVSRIGAFLVAGFFLFGFLSGLSGCNSGGSGGASTNNQSGGVGRVAVLLTDGPTEEFDEVNVTITEIKLLSDDGQVIVFSGNETVNLLDLTSHANLFAFVDAVPAGIYNKIRLIVDEVSLVRYHGQGSDTVFTEENDDEVFHPKKSGNGKIDLNPRGPFVVVSGETLYIQLDMDANKSIKIGETGAGDYVFRPVVFVNVVDKALSGKLVRLSGVVKDIDADDQEFYLCRTGMNYSHHGDNSDDYASCVKVKTDQDTSFFNSGGFPASFDGLTNGEPATILGHFKAANDDDYDEHHLIFNAAVIELAAGDVYQRFSGVVDSAVSDLNSFDLILDAAQGITSISPIKVELIEGAKVFSMSGIEISINDIIIGRIAKVEGLVQLSDTEPDKIMAAVIILGAMADNATKLSGEINDIGEDQEFNMIDLTLGDRCVRTTNETAIFLISVNLDGVTTDAINFVDLQLHHLVDIYGYYGLDGCFNAEHVLVTGSTSS